MKMMDGNFVLLMMLPQLIGFAPFPPYWDFLAPKKVRQLPLLKRSFTRFNPC